MSSRSIQELAKGFIKDRSDKSFRELVERIEPGLKNYINKILNNSDLTDDVYLESITKMYQKIEQYNPHFHFSTWMYRIARNQAFQMLKKRQKQSEVSYDNLIDNGVKLSSLSEKYVQDPEEAFSNMDDEELKLYHEVEKALDKMGDSYSLILLDRLVEEMSYKEIAEKYKIPESTVKIRLHRAKNKLSEKFNITI